MEFEQVHRNQRLIFNSNESFASPSLLFLLADISVIVLRTIIITGNSNMRIQITNQMSPLTLIHIFISKATNVCPIEFSCAHRLFDFILNSRPLIYSFLQGPKTKNNYTDSVRWVHIVCMLLLLINTTAVSKSSKTVNTLVNCGPWASFLISSEFFVSLTCDMRLSC